MRSRGKLRPLTALALRQFVDVAKEVAVMGEFGRHAFPLPPEYWTAQSALDLALPKKPKMSRDVSAPVKIVNICYELNAVERAIGQFLAGWRQRLSGIAVCEPRLGRE